MAVGALDTDSAALARRLELQHRLSRFDLNGWILGHVEVRPGERWLDLGCGRGEQSLPFAELVGAAGSVTSVDLSGESLAAMADEARSRGLAGRITAIHSGLDDLEDSLPAGSFDGVVGSYSLYYASDPDRLFRTVEPRLNPGGRLFFCGPSHSNNLELRRMTAEARGDDRPLQPTRPARFMEDLAPSICRSLFDEVRLFEFENSVHFRSAEDLVSYWRSHNLYEPAAGERFARLAEDHFREHDEFTNTKRGLGVLAMRAGPSS